MLPMPAMNFWSISSGLSFAWRSREQAAEVLPRHRGLERVEAEVRELGDLLLDVVDSVTNISPNVRGSTKRSWPPCVNVITTCVCFAVVVARRLGPQQLARHAEVDHEHVVTVEAAAGGTSRAVRRR